MPQAVAACGSLIHICSLRVTRLDAQGNVLNESNNSYVTNNVVSIQVNPVIEAGLDSTQVGGCDCIIASYKGTDKLKRFEFQLELPTFEPALIEMLTGATLITDESTIPIAIGDAWPKQLSCDDTPAPNVAVEWWSDLWTDDAGSELAVCAFHLSVVVLADRPADGAERLREPAVHRVHQNEHAVR